MNIKDLVKYIRSDTQEKGQYLKKALQDSESLTLPLKDIINTIGVIGTEGILELDDSGFFRELDTKSTNIIYQWLYLFNIYDLMASKVIVRYSKIIKTINQHARTYAKHAATYPYAQEYTKINIDSHDEIVLPMFDYLISYAYKAVQYGYDTLDTEVVFNDDFYDKYREHIQASRYDLHHVFNLNTIRSLELVYIVHYPHSLNLKGIYERLGQELERRNQTMDLKLT